MFKKKAISVYTLKLPSGNFRVTDLYGKKEELSPIDFHRYIESVDELHQLTPNHMKEGIQRIHDALVAEDPDEALKITESLL